MTAVTSRTTSCEDPLESNPALIGSLVYRKLRNNWRPLAINVAATVIVLNRSEPPIGGFWDGLLMVMLIQLCMVPLWVQFVINFSVFFPGNLIPPPGRDPVKYFREAATFPFRSRIETIETGDGPVLWAIHAEPVLRSVDIDVDDDGRGPPPPKVIERIRNLHEAINTDGTPVRPELNVVCILCHGNAGDISLCIGLLTNFLTRVRPRALVVFDYRGYGVSSGRPSESGLSLDVEAVLEHTIKYYDQQGTENKQPKIVLMGQSLGGAVAVHMAALGRPELRNRLSGLILQNTFASAPIEGTFMFRDSPIMAEIMSRIPQWWFATSSFMSYRKIRHVQVPIAFLSSTNDQMIAPTQMKRLYLEATRAAHRHKNDNDDTNTAKRKATTEAEETHLSGQNAAGVPRRYYKLPTDHNDNHLILAYYTHIRSFLEEVIRPDVFVRG